MNIVKETDKYKLISGDCFSVLKEMEDESVHCIITSPPYWGMRKYDSCDDVHSIGNEETLSVYIKKLTQIFHEAKRVLVSDGSFWLNIGDKFENKGMMGMPWRLALSLIDNCGWIMRNDVIWNQMKGTQSCKDRLRDSYEHFFHFVKSKKYYYDADSVRVRPVLKPKIDGKRVISATGVSGKKYRKQIEESIYLSDEEKKNAINALDDAIRGIISGEINDFRMAIRGVQRSWHSDDTTISGRAKELETRGFYIMKIGANGCLPTDIWNIVPEDTWRRDNHCAVFPEELLRIPILATCPPQGTILDPFSGTGSTISAANKLGRRAIGIELSKGYIDISINRLDSDKQFSLF